MVPTLAWSVVAVVLDVFSIQTWDTVEVEPWVPAAEAESGGAAREPDCMVRGWTLLAGDFFRILGCGVVAESDTFSECVGRAPFASFPPAAILGSGVPSKVGCVPLLAPLNEKQHCVGCVVPGSVLIRVVVLYGDSHAYVPKHVPRIRRT